MRGFLGFVLPVRLRIITRCIARFHAMQPLRCLVEVDVTKARQCIREHKEKTGESLSFTAFVIACLGRAVKANKGVHAYRNWRNQLIGNQPKNDARDSSGTTRSPRPIRRTVPRRHRRKTRCQRRANRNPRMPESDCGLRSRPGGWHASGKIHAKVSGADRKRVWPLTSYPGQKISMATPAVKARP